MGFGPVQQGQFKLCHTGQQVGVVFALAHLGGHVGADFGDAGVVLVGLVAYQQVQLAVFLDLHTQLIQALDGGVAGKEVLGARAEGDDLQILDAQNGPGNGYELSHLVGQFLGGAHGILGNIALQVAHPQVVGAVQHAAVGVAAAVDHIAVTLGSRHVHHGAVEILGQQGFGGFGAKVAQEHRQGVAARGAQVGHGLFHIAFVFHRDGAFIQVQPLGLAGGGNVLAALGGQGNGEAVAADRHNTQTDFGNVGGFHNEFLLDFTAGMQYQYFLRSGQQRHPGLLRRNRDGPAATCCRPTGSCPPHSEESWRVWARWCPGAAQ